MSLLARVFGTSSTTGSINKLSTQILKQKLSYSELTEKAGALVSQATLRSTHQKRSLAKMLLVFDNALKGGAIETAINKAAEKRKPLSTSDISKLVVKHNQSFPPIPSKAGTVAMQIGHTKVVYDIEGKLRLAAPDKLTTNPITLTPSNRRISPERINEIRQAYKDVGVNKPYSNIGPMLEFMSFFRQGKASNPNLSLTDALEAFELSATDLYTKYKSGDCVVLAGRLASDIQKLGYDVGVTGQYTGPQWAKPPLPDNSVSSGFSTWSQYDQATEKVHHCCLAVRYSDQSDAERGLRMDFFAQTDQPAVEEYDT